MCCLNPLLFDLAGKISGKLHGKFVLTGSSYGLGSPGGSSRGKEAGASSQMRAIKAYGGWYWYLLVLCRQHMKSRALQMLISNNQFQNLSGNYVKGLIFIHDLSGPVGPSRLKYVIFKISHLVFPVGDTRRCGYLRKYETP